jgi:hypothetical protein
VLWYFPDGWFTLASFDTFFLSSGSLSCGVTLQAVGSHLPNLVLSMVRGSLCWDGALGLRGSLSVCGALNASGSLASSGAVALRGSLGCTWCSQADGFSSLCC